MQEARDKKPTRTCVGCGRADGADGLVRVVRGPDGSVAVDLAHKAFGRGAHVHAAPECIKKACKAGFARSFRAEVRASLGEIAGQIVDAADRRARGLVMAARRARVVAVGTDATLEALRQDAPLAIVACDAGSIAQERSIAQAVTEGRAVAWLDKAALGALLGKDEVAVCAVRDAGLARELVETMTIRSRCFACRSEVR